MHRPMRFWQAIDSRLEDAVGKLFFNSYIPILIKGYSLN